VLLYRNLFFIDATVLLLVAPVLWLLTEKSQPTLYDISVLSTGDKESAYFSVADVVSELCGIRSQTTDSASVSDTAGLLPFQPPGSDPELALGHTDGNLSEASDDILQVPLFLAEL